MVQDSDLRGFRSEQLRLDHLSFTSCTCRLHAASVDGADMKALSIAAGVSIACLAGCADAPLDTSNVESRVDRSIYTVLPLASVSNFSPIQPTAMVTGDFNNDQRPDVAVTSANDASTFPGHPGSVQVALGSASGLVANRSYAVAYDPAAIVKGDFNRDGYIDLAVACGASSSISVLLGRGDGTFNNAISLATFESGQGLTNPGTLAAADVSGDGVVDLVVGSSTSNRMMVLCGDSAGGFARCYQTIVGVGPIHALVAGELYRDPYRSEPATGLADLVVATGPSDNEPQVQFLLNQSAGSFYGVAFARRSTDVLWGLEDAFWSTGNVARASLTTGDLDKNGRLDIVIGDGTQVTTWLNNGNGTFTKRNDVGNVTRDDYLTTVAIADVVEDAMPDTVRIYNSGLMAIAAGSGDGTFGAQSNRRYDVGTRATAVATGRFAGNDLLEDVLVTDFDSNGVKVWQQH